MARKTSTKQPTDADMINGKIVTDVMWLLRTGYSVTSSMRDDVYVITISGPLGSETRGEGACFFDAFKAAVAGID